MYNQIMHFKKVVDAGGFNKASETFFISQPALSKAIKILESRLNTSLLVRNQNGIELTKAGTILYSFAISLELEYLQAMQSIKQEQWKEEQSHCKEKIRFGCSILGYPYLGRFFKEFNMLNPMSISVAYDSSKDLIYGLIEDKYDFVFCRVLKNVIDGTISYIPLVKTHEVIFTNNKNPIFSKNKNVKTYKHFKWIKLKYSKSPAYDDFTPEGKKYLSSYFTDEYSNIEVNDITMAIQLLKKEFFIILPIDFLDIFKKSNISTVPFSETLFHPHWSGILYKKTKIKQSVLLEKVIINLQYFFKSLSAQQ